MLYIHSKLHLHILHYEVFRNSIFVQKCVTKCLPFRQIYNKKHSIFLTLSLNVYSEITAVERIRTLNVYCLLKNNFLFFNNTIKHIPSDTCQYFSIIFEHVLKIDVPSGKRFQWFVVLKYAYRIITEDIIKMYK
jgi:hypothetical protein